MSVSPRINGYTFAIHATDVGALSVRRPSKLSCSPCAWRRIVARIITHGLVTSHCFRWRATLFPPPANALFCPLFSLRGVIGTYPWRCCDLSFSFSAGERSDLPTSRGLGAGAKGVSLVVVVLVVVVVVLLLLLLLLLLLVWLELKRNMGLCVMHFKVHRDAWRFFCCCRRRCCCYVCNCCLIALWLIVA